ncbi:MAG: flavin reductase family protein [Tissierellia bacterium]|nr:flavin reductase family protein [Tissierellia bacterium]MDD4781716.1 flavin reductase family protein [Tissierellia bacterium]
MSEFKEIKPIELNENTFKIIGKDAMLITAEKDGKINTMTASWGGLGVLWSMEVVFIFVRPQRYTKEFIEANDYFSLSFLGENYKKQLGYLGTVSGRDEDKIANSGLTLNNNENAPYFDESNKVIICKKLYEQDLKEEFFIDKSIIDKSYPDKDFHTVYVGKIEKVLVK